MTNTRLTYAQQAYIADITTKCTHALTLQTNLYTCNNTPATIERKARQAINAFGSFRPKLNRLLTGNGWTRNLTYLPILVPTLEGTLNTYCRNKSLHFHVALGNFDRQRLSVDTVEKLIGHWIGTGIGTCDFKLRTMLPGNEAGWGIYMHKEAWLGNIDCVDLENLQIPAHITGN